MVIRRKIVCVICCLSLLIVSEVRADECANEAPDGCPPDTYCSKLWKRCTDCSEIKGYCHNRTTILSQFPTCDRYCGELIAKDEYTILEARYKQLDAEHKNLTSSVAALHASHQQEQRQRASDVENLRNANTELKKENDMLTRGLASSNQSLSEKSLELQSMNRTLRDQTETTKCMDEIIQEYQSNDAFKRYLIIGLVAGLTVTVVLLLVSLVFNLRGKCKRRQQSLSAKDSRRSQENSEVSIPMGDIIPECQQSLIGDDRPKPSAPDMDDKGYETGSTSTHNDTPPVDTRQSNEKTNYPHPASPDENEVPRALALNASYQTMSVTDCHSHTATNGRRGLSHH